MYVSVTGTVGRDPELRFTASGAAQCNFSVAETRKWKDSNGDAKEETSWWNITAWGELGENVCESIVKGSRVVVSGRLDQRSWEDKDGNKRSSVTLTADSVGPDLRWATAVVNKNTRDGGRNGGSTARAVPADEEPW
jgi:single-strand DNA-binding protein